METNAEMSYSKKPLWQLILIYLIVGGLVYAGIYKYYYPDKNAPTKPTQMIEGSKVTLTESGYSPATLTIKVGDTVTWTNTGSKNSNVSSDPHPQHTTYSPLNLGMLKPGDSLSLKFDTAGTYTYHNHLNESQRGTIIVK